jgi:cyclase
MRSALRLSVLLALLPLSGSAQIRPAPVVTTIAAGVLLFETAPYGDVGLDGNAVAIIGRDGVLVFDSNGTPGASAAVLAEIRRRTDRPVRFVVNSHWHWDHWYGTETYTAAFPAVRVIAHEKTRALMMGPALEFNRPGLERDLPGYLESLAKRVEAARTTTPPPADLASLEERLAADRAFLDQKRNVHHVFPDVTFSDRLTIHLGEREVDVRHSGRGVTPGDAYLYLPHEKILITGDLLINPITFALGCYPTEWLRVLDQLDALDASVIVPGHGAPLHDKTLLHATMALLRRLLEEGRVAKGRGVDVDAAREEIFPRLHDLMVPITGDDAARNAAFKVQLVDWFLHRVYDEANGPLSDAIAPIPRA